ncbi:hypothetical protein V9L05_14265 [Bernardetia sp. Wsw4-3y2]|uniref:hypothetical protein n=1 Tax=Bernardetia sp. Wsw4-3y2 TaxID=3127471 RepID=UPI0030D456B6
MKNFICLCFCIILFLNFSSCTCIKNNKSKKDIDILGVWYPEKPNGNTRVRIDEKLFISEGIVDIEKFKDRNTVRFRIKDSIKVIEKELVESKENQNTISIILARQKEDKTQYNSFIFSETEIKGIMTFFAATNNGFETVEEAKKQIEEAKFKNINQELFFSEEYTKTVFPTLKSMEKITKEDYITVVKYVRSFEEELQAFAATQEDDFIEGTPYRIDKIAKKIAQKKLYFLGYNPFDLPEDGNYLKKFEGDKEIEELNNMKSEFRF